MKMLSRATRFLLSGLQEQGRQFKASMMSDYEHHIETLRSSGQHLLKTYTLLEKLGTKRGRLIRNFNKDERIEVIFDWDFEGHINRKSKSLQYNTFGYGTYHFTVCVDRPGGKTLIIDCATLMGDGLIIKNVRYNPDVAFEGAYDGRRYVKLSKPIKDGVRRYLQERGIDDRLCQFIAAHSDQRGLLEEERWTIEVTKFVKRN